MFSRPTTRDLKPVGIFLCHFLPTNNAIRKKIYILECKQFGSNIEMLQYSRYKNIVSKTLKIIKILNKNNMNI